MIKNLPKISIVIVNSRSKSHPDWVDTCVRSCEGQTYPVEIILINNVAKKETIGWCFNRGVEQATGDWVLFVGDDDYIAKEYVASLVAYIPDPSEKTKIVNITTNMLAFEEGTEAWIPLQRQCTGMWERNYLLKYPFNEELKTGIDREYIEEVVKRGDLLKMITHNFGYYYRKHMDESCAGKIYFKQKKSDIYILTMSREFIDPIANRFRKNHTVFLSQHKFNPRAADEAKLIWCEWGSGVAIQIGHHNCSAKKILRIHAYEVYNPNIIFNMPYDKFDKIIFVADHIKNYLEKQIGRKLENAVVIPNGVDLDKFTIAKNKIHNNKIAWAGYLAHKKGVQLLLFVARHFPEFEFHVAAKFQDNDVAQYFAENSSPNVVSEPWQYDINKWFKDKSYVLNTSLRESQGMVLMQGMAAGLKPLVYNWIGAEDIYGSQWLWNDMKSLKRLLNGYWQPERCRNYIEQMYDFEDKYKEIEKITNELLVEELV